LRPLKSRRFPSPWSVEDIGAAFVVKDDNSQKLLYAYFQEEPQRRLAAKMLMRCPRPTQACDSV
jgi:hypothetical protein